MISTTSNKRVTRPTISEIELSTITTDSRKTKNTGIQRLVCPETQSQKTLCHNNDCTICFNLSFASSHRAQYWSAENIKLARAVFKFSNKPFKFNCWCGHKFEATLGHISYRNSWCPYCSHTDLCDDESCEMCFNNSFACTDESKFLDPDYVIDPRHIAKNAKMLQKFICSMCNHKFELSPGDIDLGCWCPYCLKPPRALCSSTECQHCFNNSFASHEKAKYWSPKNLITPRNLLLTGSDEKFIFDCTCSHEFVTCLDRVLFGRWCKYCAHLELCDSSECKLCFNNSFASHAKAIHWSPKNKVSPRKVFKSTHDPYIFICPFCTEDYVSALDCVSRGTWCTCQVNKTETKLFQFLKDTYPMDIDKQKRFDWCRNMKNNILPFDFYIDEFKLIIELDGSQHFIQVSNWDSPEETQKNDKYKMRLALNHGYSIIRILQEEVWHDKNNWQNKLLPAIKSYSTPTIILLADIYSTFDYNIQLPGSNDVV